MADEREADREKTFAASFAYSDFGPDTANFKKQ